MATIITLLTDFGTRDGYVGVMKGTIAQIAPDAQVIDLTHQIPPQDVGAARFALLSSAPYFPDGTIHVAVVDPGVGTARRAIAIGSDRAYWVGPDNGIFSGGVPPEAGVTVVELQNPDYWRTPHPSATFHGRDIFAPVAAHLARGVNLRALGPEIDPADRVTLPIAAPQRRGEYWVGCIQAIDHFGNGVTNLPGSAVGASEQVQVGSVQLPVRPTYGAGAPGQPLALVGSHGWVEIAVNGGSAQAVLGFQVGDRVQMQGPG
jgi:S-adenosylmethionine hydrolase